MVLKLLLEGYLSLVLASCWRMLWALNDDTSHCTGLKPPQKQQMSLCWCGSRAGGLRAGSGGVSGEHWCWLHSAVPLQALCRKLQPLQSEVGTTLALFTLVELFPHQAP